MRRFVLCAMAAVVPLAAADIPTAMDGLDIPSDFGPAAQVAVQTNTTSWGKSWARLFATASELDQLWLCQDGFYLYFGLTGNLATNGNEIMVFLSDGVSAGQNVLLTGLCEGPPFVLQDMGAAYLEVGDPEFPDDDYYTRDGQVGLQLDVGFSPSYVITVDLHEARLHASLYHLSATPVPEVSPYDHPDTIIMEELDVYTTRCYLGENQINGGSGILDWPGVGFPADECANYPYLYEWQVALDNHNTVGVTDVDASGAASATRGVEIRVPLDDLGLTETSVVDVMALLTGTDSGQVSNQSLPPMQPHAPNWDGRWPQLDLSNEGNAGWDGPQFTTVDLSTVWVGTSPVIDGLLEDPAYSAGTLIATQVAPTAYGDQTVAEEVEIIAGNELDVMYVSNDWAYLYVGLTGAIPVDGSPGNHVVLFVDSVPASGDSQLLDNECWDIFSGEFCDGMNGHTLPYLPDDTVVEYDHAFSLHVDGDWRQVIHYDLANDFNTYVGGGPANADGSLEWGDNFYGLQFAYNWAQSDPAQGVPGCEPFEEPCFSLTPEEVETFAETMTTGFELALPLPLLTIDPLLGSAEVRLWAVIVNGDGEWVSDQALPSFRGQNALMMQSAGNEDDVVFTRPDWWDPYFAFDARAAEYTLTFDEADGDFNDDGDVDLWDYARFAACFGASDVPYSAPECVDADLTFDYNVDLEDYEVFVTYLSGPQ